MFQKSNDNFVFSQISDKILEGRKEYKRKQQIDKSIAIRRSSLKKKVENIWDNSQMIAFTFFIVAIVAKLAKIDVAADNASSKDNCLKSFKRLFDIPDSLMVERFYHDAEHDDADIEHYARQIWNIFPGNTVLFEEIISNLVVFADENCGITSNKVFALKKVSAAFRLNNNYFRATLRDHLMKMSNDPYDLLQISETASNDELKNSYESLIKNCNNDSFTGVNVAKELQEIARDQFHYYTIAYNAIREKRGIQ